MSSRVSSRSRSRLIALVGFVAVVMFVAVTHATDAAASTDRLPDGLLPVLQQTLHRDALTSPTAPVPLIPGDLTGVASLGLSVAIDGDTAIVGVPNADVGGNVDQGAAYVFVRQAGVWTEQTMLTGPDGRDGSLFGYSVALAGDMALIGAPEYNVLSVVGPLFPVFVRGGGVLAFKRTGTTWTFVEVLECPDAQVDDFAGASVAFDGTNAILGAPAKNNGQGAAYFYNRNIDHFIGPGFFTASDAADGDRFGQSVAINSDSLTFVVGADHAELGGNVQQGAAYVFTRNPLGAWVERAKLTAHDGAAFDAFGSRVAFDGSVILVGAPAVATGRPGAVYWFTRSGTAWLEHTLTPATRAANDSFGASVALAGDQALVGAIDDPNGTGGPGSAYVFERTDVGWRLLYHLMPPGNPPPGQFGFAVALQAHTALVGMPFAAAGAAYVFGSSPPVLSPIADFVTLEDATAALSFTVFDAETDPGELLVSAVSTDAALLPQSGLIFGGSGGNRTLTINPGASQNGHAFITITLSDGFSTVARTFGVQVLPVNSAPILSPIVDQVTMIDTPVIDMPFTIADVDTPLAQVLLFATSSNTTVVPSDNIIIRDNPAGTAQSRLLTLTPGLHQLGTSTITLFATDGAAIAIRRFTLTVEQRPALTYYLAEGSTGAFFDTDLLLANPNDQAAPLTITFFKEDGTTVVKQQALAPLSRTTIRVDDIAGMAATAFSTSISSTAGLPIVVERTMTWDKTGYGAHGEKAVDGAALQWYFAEGSQGFFSTFFLLVNPGTVANTAHVRYLRENEPPVLRDYALAPASRFTVNVAAEPDLINRSFGAIVTFDQPGVAERAMYFGHNPLWTGGHDSVGATAPSTSWFLAEGATGTFFNTFVLLANPNADDATATVTYLPATGAPVTREYLVAAGQRVTINIATEDPTLASAAVSTRVTARRPIVVERSQYWPAPDWYEAHNSFGVTATGTHWGLAEGRVGGANAAQTFILLANPGTDAADVTVRFLRADGGAPLVKTFRVDPARRFNIAITGDAGSDVPELTNEAFGAAIESTQPIAVERAMYSNANGVIWAAGTSATATRLP